VVPGGYHGGKNGVRHFRKLQFLKCPTGLFPPKLPLFAPPNAFVCPPFCDVTEVGMTHKTI